MRKRSFKNSYFLEMKWSFGLFATARVVRATGRLGAVNKKALTLTPAAINRVKELLSEKPGTEALKVGFSSSRISKNAKNSPFQTHKFGLDKLIV